jgi:hypothetical protein
MAISGPIKVDCGEVFPHGVGLVGGIAALDDFNASTKENRVQARDKDSGLPMWTVDVMDFDPDARERTFKIKIASALQPVPPDAVAGCSGPSGGVGGFVGHALHQGRHSAEDRLLAALRWLGRPRPPG